MGGHSAPASAGVKLSKVGGPEQAIAIADVLPDSVSSALEARSGSRRRPVAQTLAKPTGRGNLDLAQVWRPSAFRLHRRRGVRATRLVAPPA